MNLPEYIAFGGMKIDPVAGGPDNLWMEELRYYRGDLFHRLKEQVATQQGKIDRLQAIVHDLAATDPEDKDREICNYCEAGMGLGCDEPHRPDCLWLKAKQADEAAHTEVSR